MPRTEKPLFIDGLRAEFEEEQNLNPEEWEQKTVNPNLTIIERTYPGIGRYYVEHQRQLIAHLSYDHEGGAHIVEWSIDHNDTQPLFVIGMSSFNRREPLLNVGFRSRGLKDKKNAGLIFPQITADYRFLGERLEFEKIHSPFKSSLTTGEELDLGIQEHGDAVSVSMLLVNGSVEKIEIPMQVDFAWLITANGTNQVYDSNLPYMKWPADFGAKFSVEI